MSLPAYAADMTASVKTVALSLSASSTVPVTCTRLRGALGRFFASKDTSNASLLSSAQSTFLSDVCTVGHFSRVGFRCMTIYRMCMNSLSAGRSTTRSVSVRVNLDRCCPEPRDSWRVVMARRKSGRGGCEVNGGLYGCLRSHEDFQEANGHRWLLFQPQRGFGTVPGARCERDSAL